jgi:phospho-N-acetylmuramoyl-pentapeptide-transferase
MLYWLSAFSDTIGPLNVLRYITFRTGGAMITALVLAYLLAGAMAARSRYKQDRSLAAGATILSALVLTTLLWANPVNPYVWIVLGVALGFGLIGLVGAWMAARRQPAMSDGVRIVVATSIALAAAAALVHIGRPITATSLDPLLGKAIDLGWLYVPAAALIIVAAASIADLAGRLSETVISPLLIATLSLAAIVAYIAGNSLFSTYVDMRYVPGSGELAVLCAAAVGATLGCLWSKARSEAIFTGDTVSFALGGMLGTVAVATKHEAALALICCLLALTGARPNLNMNG